VLEIGLCKLKKPFSSPRSKTVERKAKSDLEKSGEGRLVVEGPYYSHNCPGLSILKHGAGTLGGVSVGGTTSRRPS